MAVETLLDIQVRALVEVLDTHDHSLYLGLAGEDGCVDKGFTSSLSGQAVWILYVDS